MFDVGAKIRFRQIAEVTRVFRRDLSDRVFSPVFAAAAKAFQELVNGFAGSAEARTAQQELSDLGL